MSLQYFDEKNIFLSQYCVQKCLVCIRPEEHNDTEYVSNEIFYIDN